MALGLTLFVGAALVVMLLTMLVNAFTFPRLWRIVVPKPAPRVSVLIPARDEARVIGKTVSALLGQAYPNFEVLVLDDHSTDGTAEIATAAAKEDPRLRVLSGQPLPPGWLGKNWACHQLAAAATGDWLVFSDADVQWRSGALTALLDQAERSGADVQTIWPTQLTETWGERLVVPLMALVIVAYLPALAVHWLAHPAFAAANGQCLTFRRDAYDRVGGHAAVRGVIVEDIALARRAKAAGLQLRMADGAGMIACRMYESWPAVRDGYAKNIIAGYGDSVAFLLAATLFHWLVFLGPWLWLLVPTWPGWPLLPLGLGLLGIIIRAGTARLTRQRIGDALFMPLSVVLMTRIAVRALAWRWWGGPKWKGRTLRVEVDEAAIKDGYSIHTGV